LFGPNGSSRHGRNRVRPDKEFYESGEAEGFGRQTG
jgi:hypothetical protein